MKKCIICGEFKEITEFNKHPTCVDGHIGKCKSCEAQYKHNLYEKARTDPNYVEKERLRGREKHHRLGYKAKRRKKMQDDDFATLQYLKRSYASKVRYRKYPEKMLALCYTTKMKRGDGNVLHHWSYNKEHRRDIIELTLANHFKAHRFLIYDQERFMYRTTDGELLDTKQRHTDYIFKMITEKPD
jgi:hypothetical protein